MPEGAVFLEQLYMFGRAHRDPRACVISVAHYVLVRPNFARFVQAEATGRKRLESPLRKRWKRGTRLITRRSSLTR